MALEKSGGNPNPGRGLPEISEAPAAPRFVRPGARILPGIFLRPGSTANALLGPLPGRRGSISALACFFWVPKARGLCGMEAPGRPCHQEMGREDLFLSLARLAKRGGWQGPSELPGSCQVIGRMNKAVFENTVWRRKKAAQLRLTGS